MFGSSRLREIGLATTLGSLTLLAAIVLGLRFTAAGEAGIDVLKVGAPAPNFVLPSSDGATVALADMRGQPVWITFWATWCPPCRTEMPDLEREYERNAPPRYTYLAISFGEEETSVKRYLTEIGYKLPVALDVSGDVSLRYGVLGLPTHFFVDEEGVLQDVYVGIMTPDQMAERTRDLW